MTARSSSPTTSATIEASPSMAAMITGRSRSGSMRLARSWPGCCHRGRSLLRSSTIEAPERLPRPATASTPRSSSSPTTAASPWSAAAMSQEHQFRVHFPLTGLAPRSPTPKSRVPPVARSTMTRSFLPTSRAAVKAVTVTTAPRCRGARAQVVLAALCGIVSRSRCRRVCAARALGGGVGRRRPGCRVRSSSPRRGCRSRWVASGRCCAGCVACRDSSGPRAVRSGCACRAPRRSVARWCPRLTSGSPARSHGRADAHHGRRPSPERPTVAVIGAVAGQRIPDRAPASRAGFGGGSWASRTGWCGAASTRCEPRSTIACSPSPAACRSGCGSSS
jgi:hypothetical protein